MGVSTRSVRDSHLPPSDLEREISYEGGISLPDSHAPADINVVTEVDLTRHIRLLEQANRDNRISYLKGGTTKAERRNK